MRWSGLGVDAGEKFRDSNEGDVDVRKENEVLGWRYGAQILRRGRAVGELGDFGLDVGDEAWLAEGLEVARVGSDGEALEVRGAQSPESHVGKKLALSMASRVA